MKDKITIWIVFALIGLGTHELIGEFIRPEFGKGDGSLSFILGILPNYLAASLIFPFGLLTIRDSYTTNIQKKNETNLNNWFWSGIFCSQICLILWEFMQMQSENLIYDSWDIIATLLGGITAFIIFRTTRRQYIEKMKKKTAHNNGESGN